MGGLYGQVGSMGGLHGWVERWGGWVHGWVEACANGQVGCMGGFIDVYRNGNVVQ